MLGFSREVAREVTHPEWPSRVPLRMSCSVILRDRLGVAQSICDVGFVQNIKKYSSWAGSLSDTLKALARTSIGALGRQRSNPLRFPTLSWLVYTNDKKIWRRRGSSVDLIVDEEFTSKRKGDSRDHLLGGVFQGQHA